MSSSAKPTIRLTPRDRLVLAALAVQPHLLRHIAALFFAGAYKLAARRMRALLKAGHVRRASYYADGEGRGRPQALFTAGGRLASGDDLAHALGIVETRVVLTRLLVGSGWDDTYTYGRPELASALREIGLVPDSVWLVKASHHPRPVLHTVEFDRGREPLRSSTQYSIASKLERYNQWWDDDGYRQDFGAELRGFRMLFLTPTAARVAAIVELAREVGAGYAWVGQIADCWETPNGPIWTYTGGREEPLFLSLPEPPSDPPKGGRQPGEKGGE